MELQDRIYKGLAARLLDYLITGRRIELPDELMNIVVRMSLPGDGALEPVVIAVAHRLSNPDEISERFRDKVVETFGKKPRITERHLELAEYLARKNTGRSLQDNFDLDLARHPDTIKTGKGTKAYRERAKVLKSNMKVYLLRLQDMVDEITGYKKT